MSVLSHERPASPPRPAWWTVRDLWASLAITAMWLAVVVTALAGPYIETASAGGDHSRWPAAVLVALFATIATWAVARYAFKRPD